jgi:hypothetical protein
MSAASKACQQLVKHVSVMLTARIRRHRRCLDVYVQLAHALLAADMLY